MWWPLQLAAFQAAYRAAFWGEGSDLSLKETAREDWKITIQLILDHGAGQGAWLALLRDNPPESFPMLADSGPQVRTRPCLWRVSA